MMHILLASSLTIALAFSKPIQCPKTQVINLTDAWTSVDQSHYEFNKGLCAARFKESVCLKKFIKTARLTYQVICSRP